MNAIPSSLPNKVHYEGFENSILYFRYAVELHLSGCWLSGSPIIRNSWALQVNLSRIQQN